MTDGPRPPFDPLRASFYLVAGVLVFQCVYVAVGGVACLYWSGEIIAGRFSCESLSTRLSDLLTGALAAALGFAGGYWRK